MTDLGTMTVPQLLKLGRSMGIVLDKCLRKADIIAIITHLTPKEPEPFSREYHEAKVDRLAVEMRGIVAKWLDGGNDAQAVYRLAGRMQVCSRSLSAELAGIALLNQKERNFHL